MKTQKKTGMPDLRQRRPDEEMVINNLAALIPIPMLQQIQDAFSSALRMPILFVSDNWTPFTKSSGLETFCTQFTRKVQAKRPCAECGRSCREAAETGETKTYECPMGLYDILQPITADGNVLGYILTTQTRREAGAPKVSEAARAQGMTPSAATSYAARIPVASPKRMAEVMQGLSALAGLISELAAAVRQNLLSTVTDSLTGVASRSKFWECLTREIEIADTHNYPVSLLLIDLDEFKTINDSFGHDTGDKILRAIGQILTSEIRASDAAARYGSDAFLVMLRCTDPSGAEIVSWRIKNKIANCDITAHGQKVSLTASIGQVTYPISAARNADELFKEARTALERSRSSCSFENLPKAA